MASRAGEGGGVRAGLTLFGEVVITGVLVAVLTAPLITALPALAAGIAHLRRQLTGDSVRMADVWADFTAACRALWPLALAFPAAALLLLWNLSLAQTGLLPGGAGVRLVSMAALAAWAVLLLRTAAAWHRDATAGGAVREAAVAAREDLTGSLLLALAAVMCVVFVWMLLPMILLAGGLLALAALAVQYRYAGKAAANDAEGAEDPEGLSPTR
ncbi:hypothetical protein [Streptomyces xiamenensis]|jgi:hypothetical protein|uniref:hypothetical protein n=1 Tax=Streptomyces xiamenensis TaxID=408015 RepID=UPI0037D7C91B